MPIQIGLSLFPDKIFLNSTRHLFESGQVDVLEWSFDTCWGKEIPLYCQSLLKEFSDKNALYGHGVSFSLLTAERTPRQINWLNHLKKEMNQFKYQNISEHFGFLTTHQFIQGAPLSLPCTKEVIDIGINNFKEIQKIVKVPVGLENLGFAFSKDDIYQQGKCLTAILDAVDGFLLLDIHNIYCHMMNFDMSFEQVCETLPIDNVKIIHVAGGMHRAIEHNNKDIYCDSHDAPIPDDLWIVLEKALPSFVNAEALIFERMGSSLTDHNVDRFLDDFNNLKILINKVNKTIPQKTSPALKDFPKTSTTVTKNNTEDAAELMCLQEFLLDTLYTHTNVETIQSLLKNYRGNPSYEKWLRSLDPSMLEVAARMTQAWGKKL